MLFKSIFLTIVLACALRPSPTFAQATSASPPATRPATKELKLPGVTIDREKKEVRIEAEACLESGLLEYAVCKPGTFEHEALFTTTAKPELIHAALLLCGLKASPQIQASPELWWMEAIKNQASRLQIHVEWEEKSQKKRFALHALMQSRTEQDPTSDQKKSVVRLAEDAWVFCGSFIHTPEGGGAKQYAANLSGVVVGIWPDPTALIQYGIPNENPYENVGSGLEINEENMPKTGTKVQMIFTCQPAPPAPQPAPQSEK